MFIDPELLEESNRAWPMVTLLNMYQVLNTTVNTTDSTQQRSSIRAVRVYLICSACSRINGKSGKNCLLDEEESARKS